MHTSTHMTWTAGRVFRDRELVVPGRKRESQSDIAYVAQSLRD